MTTYGIVIKNCSLAAVAAVLSSAFPAARSLGGPLWHVRRGGSAPMRTSPTPRREPACAGDSSAPFLGYRLLATRVATVRTNLRRSR